MNSRTLIIFVVVAMMSAFAWIKIFPNPKSDPSGPKPPHSTLSHAQEDRNPKREQTRGKYDEVISKIELTEEEAAAKPDDVEMPNWLVAVFFHRCNVQEKNGDVEFHGKVIDQDGRPIEGVTIEALSRQYVESIQEQVEFGGGKVISKNIETSSDSSGLFSISGFRGRVLRFKTVQKPGYAAPSKLPTFSYSPSYAVRHHPDATAPVIFPMWKEGITEPLIKYFWRRRIVPDGKGHSFDLRNTRSVNDQKDGNLEISVFADYAEGQPTRDYPWVVTLESHDGGMQISNDPFPYRAPEEGYQPSLTWNSSEIEGKWTRDLNQTLYFKSPNGNFYATVKLSAKIFHTNSASITIDLLLNPSGSRNLQFDPSKKIN